MVTARKPRPVGVPHYLPGNKISWSPPTVIFIKAVTGIIAGSDPEVLELTGWWAKIALRAKVPAGRARRVTHYGDTAGELADWIIDQTRGRDTTWIFTHNAALDLVTTRLPLTLAKRGFTVGDASLSGSAPWMRLAKSSRRIAVTDSFSWLPHTAEEVAKRTGHPWTQRTPSESLTGWARRSARQELDTIAAAMLELLDWWDRSDLGKWSISGPSTGWHAMRHIPRLAKVVIDPDPARIAADRRAIYGGRRGAWVVGSRSLGPFLDLDFANAYPSVAADLPLPSRRGASFASLPLTDWRLTSDRWGVIAEVVLRTEVPRWPVRFPGGTFCPVGQFHTVLAGPEIKDALRLGCLVRVGPGITHQLNAHLQNWGRWIIDQVRNTTGNTPVAAQLAAKHWSRSVIGKWSARSYENLELGEPLTPGWGYREGWDHESQHRFGIIDIAGRSFASRVSGDAEQAYPAVFAWVESETRVRLTRTIEAVGEGAVLQCDTDGLIINQRLLGTDAARGHLRAPTNLTGAARVKWVLDQLDPIIAPLTIRVKAKHQTVRILGPQHVQASGERSFAGLPKLATEGKPDEYTFKQWPGLSSQLSFSDQRGYVRPESTVRVVGPYAPGWVLTDGRVVPPHVRIGESGANQLVGWQQTPNKPQGATLAPDQHPTLAALW